jgi:hypothetical protein
MIASAFGVPPSYLVDQGKDPSVLDEEVLAALSDGTAGVILRESADAREGEGGGARNRAPVRGPDRMTPQRSRHGPADAREAPRTSADARCDRARNRDLYRVVNITPTNIRKPV